MQSTGALSWMVRTSKNFLCLGQDQVTLKACYKASLASFLYILRGQECLPSKKQPLWGNEAIQGSSELGLAEDKIQKVTIPAEAGLLTSLVFECYRYTTFDPRNILRLDSVQNSIPLIIEGVYLRKVLQVLSFYSL